MPERCHYCNRVVDADEQQFRILRLGVMRTVCSRCNIGKAVYKPMDQGFLLRR